MLAQIRRKRLSDIAVVVDHQNVGLTHLANPVPGLVYPIMEARCGGNCNKLYRARHARQFEIDLSVHQHTSTTSGR
jgi:hypothetical protein